MLTWSIILFAMGIFAFLDSLFNYGEVFRAINSVCFMLIALGILVRTSLKIKTRRIEGLIARVDELESQLMKFKASVNQSARPNETEKIKA